MLLGMTFTACNNEEPTSTTGKGSVPALAQAVINATPAEADKALTDKKYAKVKDAETADGVVYVYPAALANMTADEAEQAAVTEKEFVEFYLAIASEKVEGATAVQKFESPEKAFAGYKDWGKFIDNPEVWMAVIEFDDKDASDCYYIDGVLGKKYIASLYEQIDAMVAAGTITKEQADAYKAEFPYGDRAAYNKKLAELSLTSKFFAYEMSVVQPDKTKKEGETYVSAYTSYIEEGKQGIESIENQVAQYNVAYGDISEYLEMFDEPASVPARMRKMLKK